MNINPTPITYLEILDRTIASLRQTIKRQALSPIKTPNGARLHADNMACLARAIANRALITN